MDAIKLQFWVIPGLHRDFVPSTLNIETPDKICKLVCKEYDTTLEAITRRSKSGKRCGKTSVTYIRYVLLYLLKHYTPMSLKAIGAYISPAKPYDHTSILYGVKQVIIKAEIDPEFREKLRLLRLKISGDSSEFTIKDSPSKTPKP